MKLTKAQRHYLEDLQKNKILYVGYNCPSIIRTFDSLIKKGLVTGEAIKPGTGYGKRYRIVEK